MSKKIAVVAANGRAAQKIISEAVERGLDVTAFGRHENNTQDMANNKQACARCPSANIRNNKATNVVPKV